MGRRNWKTRLENENERRGQRADDGRNDAQCLDTTNQHQSSSSGISQTHPSKADCRKQSL